MKWMYLLLIPAVLWLVWQLYVSGWACFQTKTALTFLGRPHDGSNGFSASFTGCTGTFGRCLCVKQGGNYHFTLDRVLTKGTACAQVIRGKEVLLVLDEDAPAGTLSLDSSVRYRIVFRFQRASGSVKLSWEAE